LYVLEFLFIKESINIESSLLPVKGLGKKLHKNPIIINKNTFFLKKSKKKLKYAENY
jgi:hypothetical protein